MCCKLLEYSADPDHFAPTKEQADLELPEAFSFWTEYNVVIDHDFD